MKPMTDQPAPTAQHFRILPLGDAAVTVEFGNNIDPAVNARVVAFAESVRAQRWAGVLDVVPTYRSVTIHVDPLRMDVTTLSDRLLRLPHTVARHAASSGTHHTIPVLYGGEWGPDLEDVAAFAKMSAADVIRLHSSVRYRVYMLGFSPGFPYLGSVPEPLAMPRLATPRTTVPAGSVGIAGSQTGIYPTATPGGWRLIGRTPLALSRPNSSTPFLLTPGDLVRFEPIGPQEFDRLHREQHDEPH
jgi:KipI family sensor histidine kinase inhibitor